MKIILSESQLELILESDKLDVLVNKIGLIPVHAKRIAEMTGKMSIWYGEKIYNHFVDYYRGTLDFRNRIEFDDLNVLNKKSWMVEFFENNVNLVTNEIRVKLTSILDWVAVGLNGNIRQYDALNFNELYDKSVEWHNAIEQGGDIINFIEEDDIIIDYRDDNGIGFYWVDLKKNMCSKESKRMGHCGSSRGNLYSLREYKRATNKYTLNKSHLTASINNGSLLQLKGSKNSKPKKEYHKYIMDLLLYKDNGNYLINSIGKEYDNKNDFNLGDLSDVNFEYIMKIRPNIIDSHTAKLLQLEKSVNKVFVDRDGKKKFILNLKPDEIKNYVEIVNFDNQNFFNDILERKPMYDLIHDLLQPNWEHKIYLIDNKNKKFIREILKNHPDFYDMNQRTNFKEMIDMLDDDNNIKNVITKSIYDTIHEENIDEFNNALFNILGVYGKIISYNKSGVKILIGMDDVLRLIGESMGIEISDIRRVCNQEITDPFCFFKNTVTHAEFYGPEFNEEFNDIDDGDKFNHILFQNLSKL